MAGLNAGLVIGNQVLWDEVHTCLTDLPAQLVLEERALGELGALAKRCEDLRLDVLLIDLTRLGNQVEEVLKGLRSLPGSPMVIALNDRADSSIILAAMRSGASEFLFPPLADGLRAAIDRLALDRKKTAAANRQRGRSLAFLSVKGGCGATTIACHVAAEIDRLTGQEVLLADVDMDSGMVGFLMKAKGQYSIVDAAQNVHRLDLSYWSALVSSHTQGKLEIVTAPPLAGLRNGLSGESFHQVFQFLRGNYDWVVADLGRSLDHINFAVLDTVDEIYLVSTFDLPALHLGKQVIQRLLEAGFGRNQLRLILNRAPKRPDFSSGEVQKALGLPVFDMLPNDYPELYQAYSEGNLLPNTSELAKSLAGLASKITGVQPKEKAKQKSALSLFQF